MGHGASLQEGPTQSSEEPKSLDEPPRKEAFGEPERPATAKSMKNAKSKEEGKRKQSKDNSNADKNKENVLRTRMASIASVTIKGPGKFRLRRQRSNNMVTPIAAIHSDGSETHSANSSRQSSAKKDQHQPLFSRRKESMAIPTNTDTSNGRLPRSSSASSIRASDDSHDRPPSGRSTPKLARPRSRRHSRSAVTPVDSPTAQRSPERDPNAIASAFSTTQPVKTQDITTVEDFD